ncbi:putative HTH-type transcriptional regulator YybR [Planctomycetes bacterium Pan216]|uniref:Putative HTH-type transcriptional regulator YybR n=1 Tax=Kolteria novifilia TaxID=2527975 RepID=A0A518AXG9_9BACT|nr:putative HTH-type transcriptional regulator YybR [Planctomycetes bacterium Pan216]
MANRKKKPTLDRRSNCPVACVLDLVGDKWTLLVVRDLALGVTHFEEFLDSPEKIATNILSDRLKRLQAAGYITKETEPADKRKSIYTFTERGKELKTLMGLLARWGLKNIPNTSAEHPEL